MRACLGICLFLCLIHHAVSRLFCAGCNESAAWFKSEVARRPALRPLTLVIKYFLYSRGLHETFHGGLGSFATQLMALSSLQLGQLARPAHTGARTLAVPEHEHSLGAMLIAFLNLYGKSLNYVKVGISVRRGGSYFLKTDCDWFDPKRPCLLSLENPLDPTLDVGKNSFNVMRIKKAFELAHDTLLASPLYQSEAPTLLSRILAINDPIYARRERPARRVPAPVSERRAASSSSSSSFSSSSSSSSVKASGSSSSSSSVAAAEAAPPPPIARKVKKRRGGNSDQPIDLTRADDEGEQHEGIPHPYGNAAAAEDDEVIFLDRGQQQQRTVSASHSSKKSKKK